MKICLNKKKFFASNTFMKNNLFNKATNKMSLYFLSYLNCSERSIFLNLIFTKIKPDETFVIL